MKNKKGFGFLWIVIALGVLLVLGSALGLIFLNKIVDALGSKYLIIASIFILLLVFHKFAELVLLTIWGWVRAIASKIGIG